ASVASAAGITRPLTLTEKQGVLSTLERTRVLSAVEGTSSDTFAAAVPGAGAVALLAAAFVSFSSIEDRVLRAPWPPSSSGSAAWPSSSSPPCWASCRPRSSRAPGRRPPSGRSVPWGALRHRPPPRGGAG
ncbi:unnamed protein product, partial [Prorocentrum cordatum]